MAELGVGNRFRLRRDTLSALLPNLVERSAVDAIDTIDASATDDGAAPSPRSDFSLRGEQRHQADATDHSRPRTSDEVEHAKPRQGRCDNPASTGRHGVLRCRSRRPRRCPATWVVDAAVVASRVGNVRHLSSPLGLRCVNLYWLRLGVALPGRPSLAAVPAGRPDPRSLTASTPRRLRFLMRCAVFDPVTLPRSLQAPDSNPSNQVPSAQLGSWSRAAGKTVWPDSAWMFTACSARPRSSFLPLRCRVRRLPSAFGEVDFSPP